MFGKIFNFLEEPFIKGSFVFIVFLSGLFCGFFMCVLIYLFFVFKNLNKKFHKLKIQSDKLSGEEMQKLIKKTQDNFKKELKKNKKDYARILLKSLNDIIMKTSFAFYPKSPFPYLELTLDESLSLMQYLHDRLENLFQKKILFIFKKMTLRRILTLKIQLVDKKYYNKIQKIKEGQKKISNIMNFINPFHWIKKITLDTFYDTIYLKIGYSLILIVGEEMYKIYSKKLFENDQDIDEILQDLKEENEKQKQ